MKASAHVHADRRSAPALAPWARHAPRFTVTPPIGLYPFVIHLRQLASARSLSTPHEKKKKPLPIRERIGGLGFMAPVEYVLHVRSAELTLGESTLRPARTATKIGSKV